MAVSKRTRYEVLRRDNRVAVDETFRYFAGCVWRVVTEMQEAAKALLDTEGVDAE